MCFELFLADKFLFAARIVIKIHTPNHLYLYILHFINDLLGYRRKLINISCLLELEKSKILD